MHSNTVHIDIEPQCEGFAQRQVGMDRAAVRAWSSVAIPMLALAALVVVMRTTPLPPVWHAWKGALPWLVMASGALIALRFRRGAVAVAMLVMGGLWWVLGHPRGFEALVPGLDPQTLVSGLWVALPLVLMVLALGGERGAMTTLGGVRSVSMALLLGGVIGLARPEGRPWRAWLQAAPEGWVELPMAFPAVVTHVLAVVVLLVARWRGWGNLIGGFLGTVLASALVATVATEPHRASVYLTAGALLMTVAVLQESYGMAFLDELTRLPGRRALNEELLKLGRRYSIAMLDVDHFKKFNDTYGHDVGDDVLRMVAEEMRHVRGGGRPFRYGGEEFTIVFRGKGVEDAEEHLEAVRAAIEAATLSVAGKGKSKRRKTVSVTISIGVAQRCSKHKTPEAVIKAADKALYRAKKKGRNQGWPTST
ncbi:MAG: GGDEF domain-containing protein, partial [Myxococcota bacterium]